MRMEVSFETLLGLLAILLLGPCSECRGNQPPYFIEDLNNHVIAENTPVGTPIFTLKGVDPERSELRYGIMGTDKLTVDEKTGVVTIAKPIDREVEDQLKVSVTVEDVEDGNLVVVKNVVQIADLNDNPVEFSNKSTYESVEVMEDIRVGSRVLSILLRDPDLTGLELSLNCTPTLQSPEACQVFPIEVLEATSGQLKADIRLGQKLDYNRRSLYQFVLTATDGEHVSTAGVLIRVKDVQNTGPVFVGAMSGRVLEDSPVGTLVMIIEARDGDMGIPRNVKLTLLSNPGDSFQLDSKTGHLITTRPLDRETLGSMLTLEVKAQELPRSEELMIGTQPDVVDILETIANVTVLIDDVNDFAPHFNQKEFWTEISENTPVGTPLPELDILVTDEDSGTFADFTLRIDGPLSALFDIEPKIVSGSARPTIRVKKAFDYENPNERKFLILVVAQNIEEPELFSTCTISVSTNDENDNRPSFSREVFTLTVPESAKPGTHIGTIVATDPDSKEYGNEGIVYQLVGSGNKKFTVNPKTGNISVADCSSNIADNHTVTVTSCLDFETQKTYDLLYMASDSFKQDGFIHSIVPLQILLTDSNDNRPFFPESKFHRTILENSRQFEPRFYIRAQDIDQTSIIAYTLVGQSIGSNYFQIDETTAELSIRTLILPPGNYSFNVSANDGVFAATAPILVTVLDVNNNNPVFNSSMPRSLTIPEDSEIGTLLIQLHATDKDLDHNGLVRYEIESGAQRYFEIDEESGEIVLIKELDDRVKAQFDLVVTAFDMGTPPLRTRTNLQVKVVNVYTPLPEIVPVLQRAQVSESAKIGDLITTIQTNLNDLGLNPEEFELIFEFVQPIEARNLDNKAVQNSTMVEDWFQINNRGEVRVAAALARDMVNSVNLTVLVTSEKSKPGSQHYGTLSITIFDVNQRSPMIEDVEIETYEELPPGMTILTLNCEDPEGGQISNYYVDQGSDLVSIDNKTGEMKILGRLDYEDRPIYNVTVVCVDSGIPQLSSTGTVMVSLLNINDNSPVFNETSYSAEVDEHSGEGTVVTSVYATDRDGDVIYYEIESSQYSPAFRIDRLGLITVSKEGTSLLDRETMKSPFITLGIRAKDSEHSGYTTVQIKVRDINDVWPKMEIKNYHVGVHAPLRATQELLRVNAHGGDQDTDELRFKIHSGNEMGVFDIDSKSGIIHAARAYDESGEFRLVVEVTDKRGDTSGTDHYDRAGVFIQLFPGNFRKPEFKFPNRVNSTLPAIESDAIEIEQFTEGDFTKILGQVLASDQDAGEAGELEFYFKDEDNLVTETEQFRIETETGVIHQIKPLDREEMNRYNLVVVAKDNGKPVSTETHEVLTIVIEDIDDNKSFFETREYNFTIKENSLENTFIGQVKAKDEDEGRNAEIFYFLVATEENHHYIHNDIRVDIKSGAIYSNAVFDHERMDAYFFFIRASASPMANRSAELMKMEDILNEPSVAIVRVKIEDLNDNSPRFTSREYFAGINSNAEPGREILTFESTDVDPTSQPYLQYSLLGAHLILDDFKSGGAVLPSPFRVDPNTGRLTISPTAIRRYAGGNNRFTVKVGVKETIPPFYQDTTQVKVWVVENSQEAVLTIKTPPTEMLRDELVDLLGNITGRLVLVNKVTPHVAEDLSVNKAWSDVYVTAVDQKTSQILPVSQFLQALDLAHDRLRKSGVPLELFAAVPAMGSTEKDGNFFFNDRESFDTAFAGLVALVALLCMGLATILAVCCCLNRMYSKKSDKSSQLSSSGMKYPLHPGGSIPGTPGMSRNIMAQQPDMIEDLATDNPLWTDHKMKTYEEQELTMQVASDFENSNGTEDGMSMDMEDGRHPHHGGGGGLLRQHSPQFSHAYATLHPHPPDYDNILGEDTVAVHL